MFLLPSMRWADGIELFFVILCSSLTFTLILECLAAKYKSTIPSLSALFAVAALLLYLPWIPIRLVTINMFQAVMPRGTDGRAGVFLVGFIWVAATAISVVVLLPSLFAQILSTIAAIAGVSAPAILARHPQWGEPFFSPESDPLWVWALGVFYIVAIAAIVFSGYAAFLARRS